MDSALATPLVTPFPPNTPPTPMAATVMRMDMIAITASNSIRENPEERGRRGDFGKSKCIGFCAGFEQNMETGRKITRANVNTWMLRAGGLFREPPAAGTGHPLPCRADHPL